jgi:NAD(P)-dependent dehydrogenase (short-subunit alcohol dehydrogenase family)
MHLRDDQGPAVALVTGANKGIGFSIARGLGELGYLVLVGARDAERGEAAAADLQEDGIRAEFVGIDISDENSVNQAATEIEKRNGRLDVLVNNAAIKLEFHPSAPSQCPLSVVRRTFETNVFGTMAVIQRMLPLLRRSPAGRIVNMSSGLGSLGLATTAGTKYQDKPLLSYNVAKAAVNSLTVQFANELRGTPVKVNAADPGYTNTDMTRGTGTRTAADGAAVAIRLATLAGDGPTGGFFDGDGPLPW